ncbi:MAG: type III ribulose-bisphosphate carboxylase [Candidatus Njordarchaeia archaeon]
MGKSEWYLEFIDKNYEPSESDIIATFYVEPAEGFTMEEVAGRVASESSVGTWTTLYYLPDRVKRLMARVYSFNGNIIKVAYPIDLWEMGNIPQLISGVAGNIFGMKAVKNLRLLDIQLPKEYIKHFRGPEFGIDGLREKLKISKRPITATVPKPKIGYDSDEYAKVSYEILSGGIDLIKDDENLTSLKFNKFEDRLEKVMKTIEKVEDETGDRKGFLVNITGELETMKKRAKLVSEYGGIYVMIDIITVGWSALQTMREVCHDLKLAIHAHRAMHAAFTRSPKHGITMKVVAKTARLIGVDQIHTGAIVGKLEGKKEEVLEINEFLRSKWEHIKPTFPVSSGGLHPGILPKVFEINKSLDLVIQVGGGVMGHPDGPKAGAKAVIDVIDAYMNGIDIVEAAKKSKELEKALEKWGTTTPM